MPAYDMIPLSRYLIGSLQFSSGCPYRCEFCDIPGLYGRQPRLKTAEQLTGELEAMLRQPSRPQVIYFVDDNFIGNKKAARDMLHHLLAWQKKHYYPFAFACEATLNLAKQKEILALMHEAGFVEVFVGIETPEADALKGMKKDQNLMVPLLELIQALNSYGLEVTAGMIVGLDTDTPDTDQRIIEFIDESHIPILTLNLLQALPKTPLWDRLAAAGRLVDDPDLEFNVRFLRPHDDVVASWRRCIAHAYDPKRLFARYRHQIDATYPNRLQPPARGRLNLPDLQLGATLAWNVAVKVGLEVGLSRRVLAGGPARAQERPDRGGARHGLHVAPPDPVLARGAARRAERLVLLGQAREQEAKRAAGDGRRRTRRHHGEEQEHREDHQVHDALQHRGAAGAERDHADQQRQRQQHLLLRRRARARAAAAARSRRRRPPGWSSPMVASADPSARFRLVCSRSARAARTAARPSGSSTSAAMTIPTTARGMPSRATPASSAGVSDLARPTMATSDDQQQAGADERGRVGRRRRVRFLVVARRRQEIVAMPHRLDEHERAVEHQRHDRRRRRAATC